MDFSEKLLAWYDPSARPMPWKSEKDPYKIWLSEIILQQTRVEQGWEYYLKFMNAFPEVHDLAKASSDRVMKLWVGLGYYSRARNLHQTAKYISEELHGQFPDTYQKLLKLKGVGPYTAAAIASFSFNEASPVIDGNVHRVLSRVFGLFDVPTSGTGKKAFSTLAEEVMDRTKPAQYNQALMDFGATVCTPKNPNCERCPYETSCFARTQKRIDEFPQKKSTIKKKTRFLNFLVIKRQDRVMVMKRSDRDIWMGLYSFPIFESTGYIDVEEIRTLDELKKWPSAAVDSNFVEKQHLLTHQKLIGRFWTISVNHINSDKFGRFEQINHLKTLAFPVLVQKYIDHYLCGQKP